MMQKPGSSRILKLVAIAMFLAFAVAGVWLLFLAFEVGDVYPPYSSLRSELDGTEVLYEALERFPELRVARHYGPAANAAASGETTVIVAGFPTAEWQFGEENELRDLLRLADRGARLVLTLDPSSVNLLASLSRKLERQKPEEKKKNEKKALQAVGEKLLQVAVKFDVESKTAKSKGRTVRQTFAALEDQDQGLPGRLPWRAHCYLEPRGEAWKTIYSWTGRPVLLLRRQGKGEVVLVADSYLLTNRAMWEDRHPDFLTWLIGGRRAVLFYERHLGVAENPGFAWLIKRYKLDGVVVALLLVAGLLVWRNSVPLVPISAAVEAPDGTRTTSRGSSLLALVSRSLPASEVLQQCVEEWKKAERPNRQVSEQVEKLLLPKGDIVATYRQIMKTVREK